MSNSWKRWSALWTWKSRSTSAARWAAISRPTSRLLRPGLFRAVVAVEGGLATHDPEPFNKYLSHPRASNEAKAALMMSQTSPKSPEPYRRETVWVYSQGAPQVFQGDLDYYLGEHDLTTTASTDRYVQDAGPRDQRRLRLVGDSRALQGLGRRDPRRDLYPDGGDGAFPDVRGSGVVRALSGGPPRPDRRTPWTRSDLGPDRRDEKTAGRASLHDHRQYRQVCDHQGCRTRAALRAGARVLPRPDCGDARDLPAGAAGRAS